jgi:hypothetical protein
VTDYRDNNEDSMSKRAFICVAVEHDLDSKRKLCYHYVPLVDIRDRRYYREIRSWSAFCNPRFPKRQRTAAVWFHVKTLEDHKIDMACWAATRKRTGIKMDKVPVLKHESVDAFYAHIGYNRKTKCYDHTSS